MFAYVYRILRPDRRRGAGAVTIAPRESGKAKQRGVSLRDVDVETPGPSKLDNSSSSDILATEADEENQECVDNLSACRKATIISLQATQGSEALPRIDRMETLRVLENLAGMDNSGIFDRRLSCVHLSVGDTTASKTEVGIRFAYKPQGQFDYIFRLQSKAEAELTNDIIEIARYVNVYEEGQTQQGNLEQAWKWLDTTNQKWLLIFDNCINSKTILRFLQYNEQGSILVTSQVAHSGFIPKHATQLQDKADKAGNAEASQSIIEPLSIDTGAFIGNYDKTLQTVWDFALQQLAPDLLELLRTLAFLHPDSIPEMMLIDQPGDALESTRFRELVKLRRQISQLLECHLIERDGSGSDASLRLHRLLKRSVLARLALDHEECKRIFDNTVLRVRKVFPTRSFISDISSGDLRRYKTFLPQVISLKDEFDRSDPLLSGNMHFATLLCDAAYYLWDQSMVERSLSMSLLAEKISRQQLCVGVYTDPRPTYITSFVGIYYYVEGGRVRAYPLLRSVTNAQYRR